MSNPDDQSIPFPPDPIPFVVGQDNIAGSPPSQPGLIQPNPIPIPIPIRQDGGGDPSPSSVPYIPNGIPIPVPVPGRPPASPPPVPPSSNQTQTVLVAESLSKNADDGTAEFTEVSFKLSKGELTCIMGNDEDGVSSLFHVLALEEAVPSGHLTVLGRVVSGLDIKERNIWRETYIAHIRQSHLRRVDQTARVLVAYWLHYYDDLSWNDAKEAAGYALNKVGITHHKADIPIERLSIVEVACVSIAKSYAHSHRHRCIYLFDDLFSSLDQNSAIELVQLLRVIAREGKVVIAQMDRQDITSSFDQVLEMRGGKLQKVR